jgi:hypothetical protein
LRFQPKRAGSAIANGRGQPMPESQSLEDIKREYADLCHAMQSGVAMMMNYDPAATAPKHLRTGLNSAMVDSGALAGLLIAKGLITEQEYFTALRDKMRAEVESYERLVRDCVGGAPEITLR